ncbi:MAG: hypothetical protein ACTSVB_05495 [Candidatus Heimdallarchaeaceae archaeon]
MGKRIKPICPNCKSRKWINTMVKNWSEVWYLCSKCGWKSD